MIDVPALLVLVRSQPLNSKVGHRSSRWFFFVCCLEWPEFHRWSLIGLDFGEAETSIECLSRHSLITVRKCIDDRLEEKAGVEEGERDWRHVNSIFPSFFQLKSTCRFLRFSRILFSSKEKMFPSSLSLDSTGKETERERKEIMKQTTALPTASGADFLSICTHTCVSLVYAATIDNDADQAGWPREKNRKR